MYLKAFYFASVIVFIGGARILAVFPVPSISHQVVFRPLTQELAKRGHEVVVITTDPAFPKGQTPKNLTEIDLHDVSYKPWRDIINSGTMTKELNNDFLDQIRVTRRLQSDIFFKQMSAPEFQEVIINRSDQFDLLLLQSCVNAAISLSHVFKVPVIYVSSHAGVGRNYDVAGVPSRPALLYPTYLRQKLNNLSLWEKLTELYNHYSYTNLILSHEENENNSIKKFFGPDTPTISELENNVHMLFVNLHPIWESNRPMSPNVVYMGGIHLKPSTELPQDLKSYLDASKNGVIYISYGTNVSPSSLPQERIQILVKVFSKLPYNVLWKWDKDELPGKSANIKISKWLPQSDLLKHPNVILFITQGGLQSTDEAITAAVPLIGMPLRSEQWFNVELYVRHKIGLRVDMETLTEKKFAEAIHTIIKDDSYRQNLIKLRTMMNDEPQKPLERAVWWTEHVLRHRGAAHLRPRAANMSWSEYLDVELMALLTLSLLLFLIAFIVGLYFAVRFARKVIISAKLKKIKL